MANPRAYAGNWNFATNSPTKTSIILGSTTAVRPEIYDVDLGSSATPADNALLWSMQRATALGTTTAQTPSPVDPGDPASTSSLGINASVEPTYTANLILFNVALNQRATHRVPFDPLGRPKCPATANNGIGLYCANSSFTGNNTGHLYFNE
jgi:hypothetical protein